MLDIETCSWCVEEVPFAELDKEENQMPDGALVCDKCADLARLMFED